MQIKQFLKERLNEKIKEIEENLFELYEIFSHSFEIYREDNLKKAASERYFERIVEGCVDLASILIRYKELELPEDDEKSFAVLSKHSIISEELSKKLSEAKGMRNIIAHEYAKIDDELVFEAISSELEKDVKEFINAVKLCMRLK